MKNILVVGSLNMDMVITADRMPHMGETINGSGFMTVPGGKGANQALAAARLDGNVKMLGSVGCDNFGTELTDYLSAGGVDTSPIKKSCANTGLAMITVCGGDNMIVLEKGANYQLLPEDIRENTDLFIWADYVVMQLEIPTETVAAAAKCAKDNGCTVVFNPAPVENFDGSILKWVDIIVVNEHEGGVILNKRVNTVDDAKQLVSDFSAKGICAVVTLGGNGAVYNDAGTVKHCPAQKTTVVDTTAAGDSFIGGMCVALGEGKSMEQAVLFATKVAAIVVSRKGAGISIPSRSELNEL